MFKPTLKRSKLSQVSTFQNSTAPISSANFVHDKAQLIEKNFNSDLYVPALFSKSYMAPPSRQQKRVISPFNYWDLQYPAEVKEKLNLDANKIKSRLVGSKYGIFWLVTENEMQIWRYQSDENPTSLTMHRKFQFEKNIRAVALGHLDKDQCLLFNMKDNCEIMAIGFDHIIDLYTLDLMTLELKIIDIRIKVENNQILQKLEITDKNQILFTGDQGYLTKVTFDSFDYLGFPRVNKSHARPSIFSTKSLFPSVELTKTKTKIYTETILSTNSNKIYVLLRKQSQGSYLKRLGLKILRFLSGKIRINEQTTIIQKQIHVYQKNNRNQGQIKFEGVIRNSEIEQKIKQSYSATEINYNYFPKNQEQLQSFQNSSISNIFISKFRRGNEIDTEKLGIVTIYGLFLTLNQNVREGVSNYYNFSFDEQPKHLPDQLFEKNNKRGSNALFLRNGIVERPSEIPAPQLAEYFDPLSEKQSKLIYCLGPSNLNLLSNGLCFYFDDRQVQILKLNKQPGNILESPLQLTDIKMMNIRSWLIFSKSQITFMKKSEAYEHILTTLDALSELRRVGLSKGERQEQYQAYINNAMYSTQSILGNNLTCEALFKLLFTIAREKTGLPTQQNGKGQKIIKVSSEARQTAIEQLKFQIKLSNRLRYQTLIQESLNSYFTRWLIPKRKQVKPATISITTELELIIWKYFMVCSLENKQGTDVWVSGNLEDKTLYNLSIFPTYLISLFSLYYGVIKNMSLTQFRKSPTKIRRVINFFNALISFLSQKRVKSYSLMPNLSTRTDGKRQQDRSLKSIQSLRKNYLSNRYMLSDASSYSWVQSTAPIGLLQSSMNLKSPTEEITNEMCKIIPRILNTIQLYQIIASNSQGKYENIPTIQKFMDSISAKKEVKAALLDIFNSVDVSTQEIILKFNKMMPELKLSSDIYLAKWLKFIGKGQNSKQFDHKFSMSTQVRLSDLNQLSKRLEAEQVIKIRELFKQNEPLYLKVLINQLELRKLQLKLVEEQLIKSKSESWQKNQIQMEMTENINVEASLFETDKQKFDTQKRGWLNSQIILIRNEINSYLQSLAELINTSLPNDYMNQEKIFDNSVRVVIEQCQQGKAFINNLMDYLKKTSILPEKLYRLSLEINPALNMRFNALQQPKKLQFMSSSAIINNTLRRSKEEIFSVLNMTTTGEDSLKDPSSSKTS